MPYLPALAREMLTLIIVPDYRAHYVKRRALEKHKATPDWRDQFHLLLRLGRALEAGTTSSNLTLATRRLFCETVPQRKMTRAFRAQGPTYREIQPRLTDAKVRVL